MGSKYKWDMNPIEDFFVQTLIDDVDISKKENIADIRDWLIMFYQELIPNESDINYLDFNIKKDNFDNFKIIANNIITALWFKGIVPTNTNKVLNDNYFVFNNRKFTYNKKTKLLTIKKL